MVALWNGGINKVLQFEKVMEMPVARKIFTLTPRELLGPLNDVEGKFAPPKLFAAGTMEIPLQRPRVAVIGSRKASPGGLDAAVRMQRHSSERE